MLRTKFQDTLSEETCVAEDESKADPTDFEAQPSDVMF